MVTFSVSPPLDRSSWIGAGIAYHPISIHTDGIWHLRGAVQDLADHPSRRSEPASPRNRLNRLRNSDRKGRVRQLSARAKTPWGALASPTATIAHHAGGGL